MIQARIKKLLLAWGVLMALTVIYVILQDNSIAPGSFKSPSSSVMGLTSHSVGLSEEVNAPYTASVSQNINNSAVAVNNPNVPLKLKIPAIDVDANIQKIGLKSNGDMGAPTNYYDVGWYKFGPKPGDQGTAVIIGHLDTATSPYAVFFNLDKLKQGDLVYVKNGSGETLIFKIFGSKIYQYNETPQEVFGPTDKKQLALITCTGNWMADKKMYDERLIIFASLVENNN